MVVSAVEVEDGEATAWHLTSVRFTVENSAVRVGEVEEEACACVGGAGEKGDSG